MINMKGSIVMDVRDAVTGELKRSVAEDNVITYGLVTADMHQPSDYLRFPFYSSASRNSPRRIAASGREIRSGNNSWGWSASGPFKSGTYISTYLNKISNTTVEDWTYTDGAIPFAELKSRFDSPAQVDTINSVYLCGDNNTKYGVTAIALNTPCIQNPGEVLDITYRIQFIETPVQNTATSFIGQTAYKSGYIATRFTGAYFDAQWPAFGYGSFVKVPSIDPNNEIIRVVTPQTNNQGYNQSYNAQIQGSGTSSAIKYIFDEFKVSYTHVLEKADNRGQVMRSVAYSGYSGHWNAGEIVESGVLDHWPCSEIVSELVGDDFAFKPIQPIQNHNKDAVSYALDVDFLASCQGTISVDGDNWDNPDWPEFWRVEFSKTGAVGTSNYFFRNRRLLGFSYDTYSPASVNVPADMTAIGSGAQYAHRKTVDNDHGLVEVEKIEEYGADSYISWDNTGINIHIVNDSNVLAYDATTTPSLPVNNITYVTSTDNGDVWVSCATSGLFKITTPLVKNTATITKMTESTNGLFAGSDSNCYGLAIGHNDSVWAIFDGALSHSTNPTDATPTFTNYNSASGPQFDYIGITDGNWSSVKYIKVDRESPMNELAVMYKSSVGIETIVWWSTAGTTITGPVSGTQINASYAFLNGEQINSVEVSRRGSLWVRNGPSLSDQLQRLDWGTVDTALITDLIAEEVSRICFAYDYYDTPYVVAHNLVYQSSNTTYESGPTISSVDYQLYAPYGPAMYSPNSWDTTNNGPTASLTWQNNRASGIGLWHTNYITSYRRGGDYNFFHQLAPSPLEYLDSLNGQHSPFEEICWDKYHWNGSAWELNYYAPAIDSSTGTNYPAVRHNFDTESNYFTGRSMIDMSSAFDANNFSSSATATFVTSIQPHLKDDSSHNGQVYDYRRTKKQDFGMTLFDFSTPTRQCKLMWVAAISGSSRTILSFFEDGVETVVDLSLPNDGFAPSPNDFRVVAIFSATTLELYVNGSSVASIPLTLAYDWTNTSGDMKAFLGSRVYKWEATQRHSPWQTDFFKGIVENVQLWNVSWDATDVANDFANISGVITSKPATNLIARYELTQSLEGLETKATHALPEVMTQGLTIAFNEGTSGDSFVATDYYTFGVVDGILKDNSMSFTRESAVYFKPVDHNFATFKNENDTSVIEGVSTTQITETAFFKGSHPMPYTGNGHYVPGELGTIDVYPGKFTAGATNEYPAWSYWSASYNRTGHTHQRIYGDGYFEAAPAAADSYVCIALNDQSNALASQNLANVSFAIILRPTGEILIMESGSTVASSVGTYTLDSILRVKKTGTVITYHIIVSGVESLLYTSATAATAPFYNGTVVTNINGNSVMDAKINYTRPSYALSIGDPLLTTGKYDPKYLMLDSTLATSYAIEIDGTPTNVLMQKSVTFENQPAPDPFEVVIDSRSGWMFFNPADVGKTVTGRVTVIYDEL